MAQPSRRNRVAFVALAALIVATAIAALLYAQRPVQTAAGADVIVYKHPQCGCCAAWVRHMEQAGFDVSVRDEIDPEERWTQHGIPEELGSCHTATVGGYVIEGHVPAEDVYRLLEERPDVRGLAVPGMPVGSPGMEGPNPQPFEVLLLKEGGEVEVYRRHVPGAMPNGR